MHRLYIERENFMGIICYDVYPDDRNLEKVRKLLVNKHNFDEKKNHVGVYFYKEVPFRDSWILNTVLKIHGYRYRTYNKKYKRSGNYRAKFFAKHKGPIYRCAYCGKRLREEQVEVDHLIPVAKAKSKVGVRLLLQLCFINNVNDERNLVAACHKCNQKKLDHMGFWIIRGAIGRFRIVWILRDLLIISLIAGLAYILFTDYPLMEQIEQLVSNLIHWITQFVNNIG